MKSPLWTRPALERLEDRWCPALTKVFDGTNLTLTGSPTSGTLAIVQNAATVTVTDGAQVSTYAVRGSINVRLNDVPATVSLDLGANSTRGNVSITAGNGGDTFTVTAAGGFIAGSFSITTANGADTVSIGDGVGIAGSLTANLGLGADSLSLGDGDAIGGDLSATGVNDLSLGVGLTATSVAGRVTVNNATENITSMIAFNPMSQVGGDVSISTGNATDLVFLRGDIGGNVSINLGNGSNFVTLDPVATIGRTLSITGGAGLDNVLLDGTVAGNVSLNLGNGDNTFNFSSSAVILGRSISYVGGNGQDTLTLDGAAGGAFVTASLGAADDTFNLDTSLAGLSVDFGTGVGAFNVTVVIDFPCSIRNL